MSKKRLVEIVIKAKNKSGQAFKQVEGQLGMLNKGSLLMAAGLAAATAALAKTGQAAVRLVVDMTKLGDAYDKMSKRVGISTAALSEWSYIAQRSGGTLKDFETGLRRLTRAMQDAKEGLVESEYAFIALGISATDAKGNLRDVNTLIPEIADGMLTLASHAERMDIAQALFGRGGVTLLPMLMEGSEGIRKLADEFGKLNAEVTGAFASGAAGLTDATLNLTTAFEGLKMAMAGPIFGPLATEIRAISLAIADLNDGVSTLNALAPGTGLGALIWALKKRGDYVDQSQLGSDYAPPGGYNPPAFNMLGYGPGPALGGALAPSENVSVETEYLRLVEILWDDVPEAIDKIDTSVSAMSQSAAGIIAGGIGGAFRSLMSTGVNAAQAIGAAFESIAINVGGMLLQTGVMALLGGIDIGGFNRGGGPIRAATGMQVPDGGRGMDSIPALLTPGEYVIDRHLSRDLSWMVGAMRSQVAPLASGGGRGPSIYNFNVARPVGRLDFLNMGHSAMEAVAAASGEYL